MKEIGVNLDQTENRCRAQCAKGYGWQKKKNNK